MTGWTSQQMVDLVRGIVRRASVFPEFRKQCLSDPRAAVEEHLGTLLPPGTKVQIVENGGATLTIVLPDPVASGCDLTDSELACLSGGFVAFYPGD